MFDDEETRQREIWRLWEHFAEAIWFFREDGFRKGGTDPVVMVWDLRDEMSQQVFPPGSRLNTLGHRLARESGEPVPVVLQCLEKSHILEAIGKGVLPEPPPDFIEPDTPGEYWAILVACGTCNYLPYSDQHGVDAKSLTTVG